jgi:hypothetical protein
MIERSRLVEVGRRSNVCQICTCAKSAHLRARADQKCIRPGFILLRRILGGGHSEQSEPPRRSPSSPRQRSRLAGPNSVVGHTPFIKCACRICTLHTFRRRKTPQTLQFGGLSVWHPDCGTALRPLNTNSSTATRPSTAMRGNHEQARSGDRLSGE